MVLQSIYQAGPPGGDDDGDLRKGHALTSQEDFAQSVLLCLEEALQRIKDSWEASQALNLFVSIARRLLSISASKKTQDRSLRYLDAARYVAFAWVGVLREKAQRVSKDSDRREYLSKAAEIALVCVDSYVVDPDHLASILDFKDHASVLFQCAMLLQESRALAAQLTDSVSKLIGLRFQRLLAAHRGILSTCTSALDDALEKSWTAYVPGAGWTFVPGSDHWMTTSTPTTNDSCPLTVRFNLLNGELLVNGLPLDRPPHQYEELPGYQVLFGHSAIEVMPTAVPGMQFSAKRGYAGYKIDLGISGNDLLIQAAGGEDGAEVYQLVPQRLLTGEFPTFFVRNFVHWYSSANDTVEFRPVEDPWNAGSSAKWLLTRNKLHPSGWRPHKDGSWLVGLKSQTVTALSRVLSPLTDRLQIHATHTPSLSLVDVNLASLQLGFFLNAGNAHLKSKEFRGMSVDVNQSLGAFVGFTSKLLLKDDISKDRLVIVLEGPLVYKPHLDHLIVSVDGLRATSLHSYKVDHRLGRLVDLGNLQSKVFMAYLHAVTSFCLPDPLTCMTGTEKAIDILASAAVRSFDLLSQNNIDTLLQISKLAPVRNFYPANERMMQTVDWNSTISFLSQHQGLADAVQVIFDQAKQTSMFYPDSAVRIPNLPKAQPSLVERDLIRSSSVRVTGFGAEHHTPSHDRVYQARDRDHCSTMSKNAFIMSDFIFRTRTTLHWSMPTDLAEHLWYVLERASTILGPDHLLETSALKYDAALLREPFGAFARQHWTWLHSGFGGVNKFLAMSWLSTLACAEGVDFTFLQVLALFFTSNDLRQMAAPRLGPIKLANGREATREGINQVVKNHLLRFQNSPEASMSQGPSEHLNSFRQRRKRTFDTKQANAINRLVNAFHSQWPCERPSTPDQNQLGDVTSYVNVDKVTAALVPTFKTWFDNLGFFQYIQQIGTAVSLLPTHSVATVSWTLRTPVHAQSRKGFVSTDDLLSREAPSVPHAVVTNVAEGTLSTPPDKVNNARVTDLIARLGSSVSGSKYKQAYVDDLRTSLGSLQECGNRSGTVPTQITLLAHLHDCELRVKDLYTILTSAASGPISAIGAALTQRWPRVSPTFFLRQLSHLNWSKLSHSWKVLIAEYGLALANLQRAERLVKAGRSASAQDLTSELRNFGHTNWNPLEHPDALLLEVESGVMIRANQEQIANEMRIEQSAENVVMQLNMGEGKSSLIVPMVVATLADGSRMVRVIVAKPQSKQMAQMLISKLGGMLNRRVYYMPVSRSLRLTTSDASMIFNLVSECLKNKVVMLMQPEHILSFQLMGLESVINENPKLGHSLARTQNFLDKFSRDIVDESDENFSVKFELIYTIGAQTSVDMSPSRWLCIQQVLELVRSFVLGTAQALPTSIELHHCSPGAFPRIRVLKNDAYEHLFGRIAAHICHNGLDGFPISRQSATVREAVLIHMTKHDLSAAAIDQVAGAGPGGFWNDSTKGMLLLLRGLFAGGVLAFAFGQKRWRVNYGLANRVPATRLAVPFRAKDNPAPRSEFSQPDVVIVLTLLSYYYGGISEDDLFTAFSHLLMSGGAEVKYKAWLKDAPGMALTFTQLQGINLKDKVQLETLVYPHLRYAKGAIDYFLAIIFPKEMKEFPSKLSASGWDLGKISDHPMTGFSGTADSKVVLPLSVKFLDLPEQKHTNALVLTYLLQPQNSVSLMSGTANNDIGESDADHLLRVVVNLSPPVRVILDVGAQILELDNVGVASRWLEACTDDKVQAAVFVNDADEISVINLKGRVELLQTSSYATQLDVCIVFLDEAHTRGIDLKLPEHYRAAVTLGAGLTKDKLVQGECSNTLSCLYVC